MIKDNLEIIKYENNKYNKVTDESVVEYTLEIYVNNRPICKRLCLKENLEDMVIGFLLTQGFISKFEDIEKIDMKTSSLYEGRCYCVVYRNTRPERRHLNTIKIKAEGISKAMKIFTRKSSLFKKTGGVHSCGVFKDNKIQYFADDIGRQNALDKVIGYIIKNEKDMGGCLILFSGRITTEVLDKIIPESIEGIISKAAVTKNAVLKGKNMGILVIGFARDSRFNLYAGRERINQF